MTWEWAGSREGQWAGIQEYCFRHLHLSYPDGYVQYADNNRYTWLLLYTKKLLTEGTDLKSSHFRESILTIYRFLDFPLPLYVVLLKWPLSWIISIDKSPASNNNSISSF